MINNLIQKDPEPMISNSTIRGVLLVALGFLLATSLALTLGFSYVVKINYEDTQRIKDRVDERTSSLCAFFQPLVAIPPQANSNIVGVQILEGSRVAYTGLACPEKLPPPSQELIQLGQKYNIPIH